MALYTRQRVWHACTQRHINASAGAAYQTTAASLHDSVAENGVNAKYFHRVCVCVSPWSPFAGYRFSLAMLSLETNCNRLTWIWACSKREERAQQEKDNPRASKGHIWIVKCPRDIPKTQTVTWTLHLGKSKCGFSKWGLKVPVHSCERFPIIVVIARRQFPLQRGAKAANVQNCRQLCTHSGGVA